MESVQERRAGVTTRLRGLSRFLSACGGAAFALLGCVRETRPPCDNPPPLYVTLRASDRVNPDAQGRSLSTQVQVLQLRSLARLENAEFTDVWQKGKEVLGDDLIQVNELTLDPASELTAGYPRDTKTAFVAVVGIFRQPSGTAWRSSVQLPAVPAERCGGQPAEVKPAPGPDDTRLEFRFEDFRVEGRLAGKAPRGSGA